MDYLKKKYSAPVAELLVFTMSDVMTGSGLVAEDTETRSSDGMSGDFGSF